MSKTELTGYPELITLLTQLPILVRDKRRREQLSLRAAAKEAGVSFSSIHRMETGEDVNLGTTVLPLLNWLAR